MHQVFQLSIQQDMLTPAILAMAGSPLLAVILCLILSKYHKVINLITLGFSAFSLMVSVGIAWSMMAWDLEMIRLHLFGVNFYVDALSTYFILLVNLVAFIASFYTIQFLRFDAIHNSRHNPVFFNSFFNLFHFSMLLVPLVDNLVALWIAIELTTVFSTLLVSYRRDRPSLEAAWKFIMITTTGIIFALLGTLFLAIAVQDVQNLSGQDPMAWSFLGRTETATNLHLEPNFVMLSFIFILIGYGTKAGLAPMHTWLPDGHGQAPSPVSALLSGVMLKSALYAILRYYTITNISLGDDQFTSWLLRITGLVSLIIVTPFILKRNRFKRLLAYHSVEHMGIITFGIGLGTHLAIFAALLHALNHALTKSLMFLMYGSIQYEYANQLPVDADEGDLDDHITGVLKALPISGTILGLGGLALVGTPPFNIFMSEFMILWAGIQSQINLPQTDSAMALAGTKPIMIVFLGLFLMTVTIIFGGMVSHLARILLGRAPFPTVEPSKTKMLWLWPSIGLLFIIAVFGLLIPVWPVNFPDLLERSVEILYWK